MDTQFCLNPSRQVIRLLFLRNYGTSKHLPLVFRRNKEFENKRQDEDSPKDSLMDALMSLAAGDVNSMPVSPRSHNLLSCIGFVLLRDCLAQTLGCSGYPN